MSDAKTQFELEIRFLHVPENLAWVPLPAELVSADGVVEPVVLTVSENQPAKTKVAAPGNYMIRAELPSGRWVAQMAQVPEGLRTPDSIPATATIDLAVPAATPSLDISATNPKIGWFGLDWHWLKRNARLEIGLTPNARLEYGWFQKWGVSSVDGLNLIFQTQEMATQELELPGSIALHAHPGWNGDRHEVKPLLIHVRLLHNAGGQDALVVWPPTQMAYPLTLRIAESIRNPDAPRILAGTSCGDHAVDALFQYIGIGALASIRQTSKPLLVRIEAFLQEKEEDPVRACLAAYALLKVGAMKHPQWLANLANWFNYLPDGSIAYAWYLLRQREDRMARDYFRRALAAGIPMYSEGVRLLRDGLNFISGLHPGDSEIKADALLSNQLANVSNLDSTLTFSSVGKYLELNRS